MEINSIRKTRREKILKYFRYLALTEGIGWVSPSVAGTWVGLGATSSMGSRICADLVESNHLERNNQGRYRLLPAKIFESSDAPKKFSKIIVDEDFE